MSESQPYIGGQAVIEGVMMRSPGCLSVAVRRPDGTIVVREAPYQTRFNRKAWKLPLVRGVATLVEAMKMGFGALQFSAEQQMTEEERTKDAGGSSRLAMILGVVLAIALFKALPQMLAGWTYDYVFGRLGEAYEDTSSFHLTIGGFQLLILFSYLMFIRSLREGRRMFEYHGAEHKTINAYERGLAMTVENVRAQTTLHPRCGTTFLVMIVFISIAAGSALTPLLLPADAAKVMRIVLTLLIRLSLILPVAAVAFEIQRLFARFFTRGPLQLFLWPGFLFQKITTSEPDDKQIEIAIAAMQTAEWRERIGKDAPVGDELLVFSDFEVFSEALPELRGARASAA